VRVVRNKRQQPLVVRQGLARPAAAKQRVGEVVDRVRPRRLCVNRPSVELDSLVISTEPRESEPGIKVSLWIGRESVETTLQPYRCRSGLTALDQGRPEQDVGFLPAGIDPRRLTDLASRRCQVAVMEPRPPQPLPAERIVRILPYHVLPVGQAV